MIETPNGSDFWVEGSSHDSGRDSSGQWVHTKIDLEFISIEEDIVPTLYQTKFLSYKHFNYFTKDKELGPVVISVRVEIFSESQLYHVLLRLIGGTLYKCIPYELLPNVSTFEQLALIVEPRLKLTKLHQILISGAPQLINSFDLHTIINKHKFGLLYQRFGQTTEEEILSNCFPSEDYNNFLSLLGNFVTLKDFDRFSGGLDTKHNLTGTTSLFTMFQDREIMFHVSTMLPYDETDLQQIQRKRHIGNDIVAIIFQDENAVYIPGTFKSHFLKVILVIQPVKDFNNQTLYKLKLIVDQECSNFNPLLPHPPVYLKNDDFRTFLLIKMINAEFSASKSPQFAKLNYRTREQLLQNLIVKLNSVDSKTCDSRNELRPNNSIKRKQNYIFKSNQSEGILKLDRKMSLNTSNNIESYQAFPMSPSSFNGNRHNGKSCNIPSSNLSLSNPSIINLNLKSKSITSVSGCNPLASPTYLSFNDSIKISTAYKRDDSDPDNHFNHKCYLRTDSNNHHVSHDENSFSSMILGCLSTSLRLSDSIGCNSLNSTNKNGHSPIDFERDSNSIYTRSVLNTKLEFNCVNHEDHPNISNNSQIIPVNEQYDEGFSEVNILKDQLKKVMSEDKFKGYNIQYLQKTICTLLDINKDLMRRLSKQSKEIKALNSDLCLFAYYQKHYNLSI